jgi:hypothetical protein
MLRDLSANPGQSVSVETDFAIIGGGTVGLLMASRLAQMGRKIVVIESGGETQDQDTHPLNAIEQEGDHYAGASAGRARCLGGTSTRWGGAMLPFQTCDWQSPNLCGWDIPDGFPFDNVMRQLPKLERLFGLPESDYDVPELASSDPKPPDFLPRLAKWPGFKARNTANLFAKPVTEKGHDIWLNATATGFEMDAGGMLQAINAQSANGSQLKVRARQWIFACGAIENTRMLLLLDRAQNDRIFAPDNMLGRYFHDHISAPIAVVTPRSLTRFNSLFSFSFEGSAMRNLRFEPTDVLRKAENLPAGFAHIAFATAGATGFDALRDIYRGLQAKTPPRLAAFGALAKHAPWLARAGYWRYIQKRVLFPPGANFTLNMVCEQKPEANNCLTLSNGSHDVFGQPLAHLAWRISSTDEQNIFALSDAFTKFWNNSSLHDEGDLTRIDPSDSLNAMRDEGGVYHPGGTTRISADHRTGVTNSEGRCHRVANIWPVSTALFSTGGGANPTMTLLLMGLQIADQIGSSG